MTNKSDLLPILSELAEYVEFDYRMKHYNVKTDKIINNFLIINNISYYIPSVEWLRHKCIELARIKLKKTPNWTVSLTWREESCHQDYHANIFFGEGLQRKSIFAINEDDTTAIASLLLKLCKSKEI